MNDVEISRNTRPSGMRQRGCQQMARNDRACKLAVDSVPSVTPPFAALSSASVSDSGLRTNGGARSKNSNNSLGRSAERPEAAAAPVGAAAKSCSADSDGA